MKPLCIDTLTSEERIYLGNMASHPGFIVFKKLVADACKQATEEVVRLDPVDDGYERKLKALQFSARAINQFSAMLIKSIEMHSLAAVLEEENKELEEQEEVVEIRVGNPLARGKRNIQ